MPNGNGLTHSVRQSACKELMHAKSNKNPGCLFLDNPANQ